MTGFTLVELVITLAIAAIITTMAVPSFQEMIRKNRMATQTNEFIAALHLARSEAIKRGQRITVCKSTNSTTSSPTCNTSNSTGWDRGWIVFVDGDENAALATTEIILQVHGSLEGGNRLTGNTNVADYISYVPNGMTQLTGGAIQMGTVTLCHPPKANQIIINNTGRVHSTEASCS
ncbi:GspH/FimT family pseudopilin [Nitrosococcus watsonii]|uniref:Type II secretion system protein H n=1 Tax=Nitrosococcus watsoni (strain C-113) TaxID=105559 RepID=D8K7Q8_NITWC|nr:GspH/FimT family pseudopilin [Nitrosococcus watsonii]ADJ28935.1 putative type-4 fimbrial pilin related signal peptide protein [Nitrosococcus watsonii C-113]